MFKDKLKQLRLDKGVTQSDIANVIGVSSATIGNYEQGTRKPRKSETWKKIADYFGVSIDYLIDENDVSQDNMHNGIVYRSEKEIENYVKTLTEEELRLIVKRNMMGYIPNHSESRYEIGTFGHFLEMFFGGEYTSQGFELYNEHDEMIDYGEYGIRNNFEDVEKIFKKYLECNMKQIQCYEGMRVLDCGIGLVNKVILEIE